MSQVDSIGDVNVTELKTSSQELKTGMGAVAWAVLEMFRRGGMTSDEVSELHRKMNEYFPLPSNDECNAILKVVETRLHEDKSEANQLWYCEE